MSGPLTRFGIAVESREQRQEKILAGVIASVYRQVPQSVLGSIVGAVALIAVLWQTHDQLVLNAWFIGMLLESLARLRVARAFRTAGSEVAQVRRWARRWTVLAAAAGMLWGAAGVLFFAPEQPLQQLLVVAVILGVTFGSLTLYATHPPALFAFLPLALLPLIVRMLLQHDPAYYTAAAVVFAVFGFTTFLARNFGEAMFESVKNNYENEVLVAQLMAEKKIAEDARRAAETATRSKTQFFAAASHDLRQPLQAIGIYVSLLRKRAQGPLEPLVASLSSAVESLSKLVEELLEISRLESGAIQPRIQQVLLDDVFRSLEQEFMPQAAAKGLALRVRRCGLAIDSDPLLLLRVLRNLLANAIKYTKKGGVLLAARRRGGLVSIGVWDTGPGIQKHELDRIFEEFYRGSTSRGQEKGGFGLGLSIVKRICSVLGHPLVVTTRPGTGSVFRVEVPLSTVPRRHERSRAHVLESAIQEIPGRTLVVLEDNEEILNSLTKLLASWGADIISATSFNASLMKRLGVRRHVDLIVADQNLGNPISGVEAVFRIRELVGRPVPVVMLTAVQGLEVVAEFQRVMQQRLARHPHLAHAIAASRVEEPVVLQKPTTPATLNKTLVDILSRSSPKPVSVFAPDAAPVTEDREDRVS
ncbi:MAG: ATP-binding protein [Sutterellaceae bacterium]|nr:ATP-binding protein [Burkholderiaceae bacterium]MCX7901053.1 ATP-binding protein [Burkholderiaceae bacterium]MDW8431044.1 ATP-binding protein [Sutterellaceae bacterium]